MFRIRSIVQNLIMKRASKVSKTTPESTHPTRERRTVQEKSLGTSSSEATQEEQKIDLSAFRARIKKKLESKRPAAKRQHVSPEYDEAESSNKIKKESEDEDTTEALEGPENWEQVVQNIREMRKNLDAPVDSMGCQQCPDKNASPEDKRYQALLSLMLSSQTKDEVTHKAMLCLREHGCSVTNILNTSDKKLGELIYPVSFWKTKVKHIKQATEMIRDTFNNDIPKTFDDLLKLPGVGPKMAHLCMETAWGEITGIAVDTHVHRISNRLGWVNSKTPQNTGKCLESWLPQDLWSEVNLLLVGFGQKTCRPVKPHCDSCLNNELCPFGVKQLRHGKSKGTNKK